MFPVFFPHSFSWAFIVSCPFLSRVVRFLSIQLHSLPPHSFHYCLHWVNHHHITITPILTYFLHIFAQVASSKTKIYDNRMIIWRAAKTHNEIILFPCYWVGLEDQRSWESDTGGSGWYNVMISLIYLTFSCSLCHSYPDFDTRGSQQSTKPTVGWNVKYVPDLGFVSPDQYGGPDIICHWDASPATGSVTVEAGGTVELQWTAWPTSHHGPVIDYLANCRGSCAEVDKASLKFNKIDEAGLLSNSTTPWTVGRYASNKLIADGSKWTVTIPSYVAPGNYVLRHEIIALHQAWERNGAQNYPQCINLIVTGKGTDDLSSGTPGQNLYTADEPGIFINVYRDVNYIIPGPPLYRPDQADSPKSTKNPSTEESTTISSTAGLSTTFVSDGAIVTPTPASSATSTTAPANKLPIFSPSPYVASGNFSASLASHYRSSSIADSTGIASVSLTASSTSAPISHTLHPTIVLNTITSTQTATVITTLKAGFVTSSIYGQESSPQLTSKKESVPSAPTSIPQESDDSTKGESNISIYKVDSQKSSSQKHSPTSLGKTNTPSVPEHNPHFKAPYDSTLSDLFDLFELLEKLIRKIRKELEKNRKHSRDIVHR